MVTAKRYFVGFATRVLAVSKGKAVVCCVTCVGMDVVLAFSVCLLRPNGLWIGYRYNRGEEVKCVSL